ncbi:hypothetical protein SAMN02745121_00887 [Nannocystis exedens]|uniref:Uncharacterized protein n=1 Tax=Nannocystis exedens TaxID=54 RepID=A0A1I1U1L1_9BACT|nr:hypothetical protein [Nannocystis exedens]PCC71348.1 hypothetical protein NAEX_04422 [Nannocystis exedens]SFD64604.1 hypothetical protein SAMN02745121_00887 [Nannocystis exedens]
MPSDASTPPIRTGFRRPLAPNHAHAVGAELVSRAFAGSPDYDDLWIGFTEPHRLGESAPAELRTFWSIFSVVCNQGIWYLCSAAVPSAMRPLARRILVDHGLPRAAAWQRGPHPPTWFYGLRRLHIGADFATPARMCVLELHGDRRVEASVHLLAVDA